MDRFGLRSVSRIDFMNASGITKHAKRLHVLITTADGRIRRRAVAAPTEAVVLILRPGLRDGIFEALAC